MTHSTTPADAPQPADYASGQPHRPPSADRRVFVGTAIALATLLFAGTAGLLYLRWATMREPTCVLIVDAPVTLRGAEVSVRGIGEPYTVTIGAGERFTIPFYL